MGVHIMSYVMQGHLYMYNVPKVDLGDSSRRNVCVDYIKNGHCFHQSFSHLTDISTYQ